MAREEEIVSLAVGYCDWIEAGELPEIAVRVLEIEQLLQIEEVTRKNQAYLTYESEHVKGGDADEETPSGAKHRETIELSENHDVHHETTDNHKRELSCLVRLEEAVDCCSCVKHAVLNALYWVSH